MSVLSKSRFYKPETRLLKDVRSLARRYEALRYEAARLYGMGTAKQGAAMLEYARLEARAFGYTYNRPANAYFAPAKPRDTATVGDIMSAVADKCTGSTLNRLMSEAVLSVITQAQSAMAGVRAVNAHRPYERAYDMATSTEALQSQYLTKPKDLGVGPVRYLMGVDETPVEAMSHRRRMRVVKALLKGLTDEELSEVMATTIAPRVMKIQGEEQ